MQPQPSDGVDLILRFDDIAKAMILFTFSIDQEIIIPYPHAPPSFLMFIPIFQHATFKSWEWT